MQTITIEDILKDYNIKMIPADLPLTLESLRFESVVPYGDVLICDMSINDKRNGQLVEIQGIDRHSNAKFINFGYIMKDEYGTIFNIDHHFRKSEFECAISSTNLAIGYVQKYGSLRSEVTAVINHIDCDSLLSVLIMLGILQPDLQYGEAAIAADHTGDEHPLADLLQAIEGERDFLFSINNLFHYLNNESPDIRALKLLEKRAKERKLARQIVENDFRFTPCRRIAYATSTARIDGALLVALLPKLRSSC